MNYPNTSLLFTSVFSLLVARYDDYKAGKQYSVKVDIRFGASFYSLYVSEEGMAYMMKGTGADFTKPLQINTSDSSWVFSLPSVKPFYESLYKIKAAPVVNTKVSTEAARAEIYYRNRKIFDGNVTDSAFSNLFKQVGKQLPRRFNPMRAGVYSF